MIEWFFSWFRDLLSRAGVDRDEDLDVINALIAGLADQQVANDPGGERWLGLTNQVIEMRLDRLEEKGGFTR